MPQALTYPGVYVEEIPSGVRTIVGVATSITAFIGRTRRGPSNLAVRVQSFAEFDRRFGGLWADSTVSFAVSQYFINGGTDALIVRVHNGAVKATLTVPAGAGDLTLEAANEGAWGNRLNVKVDHKAKNPATQFNLVVTEKGAQPNQVVRTEVFRNLTIGELTSVLNDGSTLVRVKTLSAERPDDGADEDANGDGDDGSDVGESEISDPGLATPKHGLWALDDADLFNLLCVPPFTPTTGVSKNTWDAAVSYCLLHRALLLVDPPASWNDPAQAIAGVGTLVTRSRNAALFFPRLRAADPLQSGRLDSFAPCGAVAGVFARTDSQRGVWKAPAGIEATVLGVSGFSVPLSDGENGQLNPLGINCLRTFPIIGNTVWGARTLDGADILASEWKYIPIRRTALFIEESLFRGTKWVVFEPNDEPLWAKIRLNVGAFMMSLFRQGAFQGTSPKQAFYVKCDAETTTQDDRNKGIVNIEVGFAPLKPAEFVVIKIQQMAGEL